MNITMVITQIKNTEMQGKCMEEGQSHELSLRHRNAEREVEIHLFNVSSFNYIDISRPKRIGLLEETFSTYSIEYSNNS